MDNSEFFVGLDIGTNSIKVVVAESSDDRLAVNVLKESVVAL